LQIFGNSLLEWTQDQVDFYNWCLFYHSLKSLPEDERPSDDVIDDDYKLDKWYKEKRLEIQRDRMGLKNRSLHKGETFDIRQ
jgi:hypothetical protein